MANLKTALHDWIRQIARASAPFIRHTLTPALITGSVRLHFRGRDRRRIKRELRKAHDKYKRRLRA